MTRNSLAASWSSAAQNRPNIRGTDCRFGFESGSRGNVALAFLWRPGSQVIGSRLQGRKAAEDGRAPKAGANSHCSRKSRSIFECASPLALWQRGLLAKAFGVALQLYMVRKTVGRLCQLRPNADGLSYRRPTSYRVKRVFLVVGSTAVGKP